MRDIVRRRVDFDFDPHVVPLDWYRGDAHLTTFWDALSLLFPEGERFFVESVRRYRERIQDPELRAAIEAFIGQEAMHGRSHRAFNDMLRARGLGEVSERAEQQLRRLLGLARRRLSGRAQLAVTCALEHYTAILAEQLLAQADHGDAGHESVRPLVDLARPRGERAQVRGVRRLPRRGGLVRDARRHHAAHERIFLRRGRERARPVSARPGAGGEPSRLGRAFGYLWVRPGILRQLAPAYLD